MAAAVILALALAMDARGFGSRACRTLARPRDLTRADAMLIGTAVIVTVAAMLVSIALGTWRPLLAL